MSSRPLSRRCLISGSMSKRARARRGQRTSCSARSTWASPRLRDRAHVVDGQLDRQQADLGAVRAEDVGEARRDDGPEAVVLQRPGRVLAARAAAEVAPGDEDLVARQVPVGLLGPVVEEELAEARALDALEELLGDDLVGVDVVAVEDRHRPGDRLDGLHRRSAPVADVDEVALDGGRGGHLRADEVGAPAAALAALEVAVRGRGAALAGLERCRGSCPGTSSSPRRASRSRRRGRPRRGPRPRPGAFTCTEPGTTIA